MSQFQVQFVLDQSSGKYLAEMHNPDNGELLVRTEALYDSQAAAAMAVIEMFKNAILRFPKAGTKPRVQKAASRKKPKPKPKAKGKKAKKAARKPAAKKAARRPKRGQRSRRRA